MSEDPKIPDWFPVVSRETAARLEGLCALVVKWNPAINLVAKSTVTQIWHRHLLDSAQLAEFVPDEAKIWVDLGSGAGFPGLVVAILSAEHRPNLLVSLVESDQRKAVFLAEVVRILGLNANIICKRAEILPPMSADVLSARALTSLGGLCGYASKHLAPGGTAIFPKGAAAADEIAEARKSWHFSLATAKSRTDTVGSILLLKDVVHV